MQSIIPVQTLMQSLLPVKTLIQSLIQFKTLLSNWYQLRPSFSHCFKNSTWNLVSHTALPSSKTKLSSYSTTLPSSNSALPSYHNSLNSSNSALPSLPSSNTALLYSDRERQQSCFTTEKGHRISVCVLSDNVSSGNKQKTSWQGTDTKKGRIKFLTLSWVANLLSIYLHIGIEKSIYLNIFCVTSYDNWVQGATGS